MGNTIGRPAGRRLMVELVGPAGVGKSTLADAWSVWDEQAIVAPHLKFRSLRNASFLLAGAARIWRILLMSLATKPRLSRREITMMLHLNTWNQAMERRLPANARVILLDHGPLYMLASLREFGPGVTQTRRFREWWNERHKYWATTLDMVVFLDAPNEVLSQRINMRSTAHQVKGAGAQEAFEFLSRYRKEFTRLMSMVESNPAGPMLAIAQTHDRSTQEIMGDVLDMVERLE